MRTMKDSGIEWIGQIPQEWGTIRAKYVTTITNGSDPKTEGDIPVYGSGSGCFKTCGEYKEGPTVLLGRKGTVDIPQYITGNYWNVDTAFDVKTVEEQLDLEFYYFASTCFDYKYYTSTTTLPSMTQTNYGNMYIPFPPVDVQRRVVVGLKEKLSGIDALIAAKEKTNALLKERRQSIIYEAVTKGLNPNAPMKDSGIEWIGKIPQDWQIAKVKHVYSFQTGWTPSTSNAAYFDGDLPWANISDIGKTKTIYDTAKHITEEAVANSSMGISPKGSLMYSFKLSVGDVSFCGTDMYTNEAIATFLPSDKYDLRYLYYAAPLFIIKNANENIYGAKLLNQELIRNALILNPPYNEQVSVANYLDAKCAEIDALISANEATIKKLKEYRQSIIYEAVTGKIEI